MLSTGGTYTGTVKSVQNNSDSFTPKTSTSIMYCHRVIMVVNNVDIDCQYCSSEKNQMEFVEGEVITFIVNSFSRGQHNIKRHVDQPSVNPSVDGTVAERALHYAVLFNQYNTSADARKVMADAGLFVDWLIKQNNGGK